MSNICDILYCDFLNYIELKISSKIAYKCNSTIRSRNNKGKIKRIFALVVFYIDITHYQSHFIFSKNFTFFFYDAIYEIELILTLHFNSMILICGIQLALAYFSYS